MCQDDLVKANKFFANVPEMNNVCRYNRASNTFETKNFFTVRSPGTERGWDDRGSGAKTDILFRRSVLTDNFLKSDRCFIGGDYVRTHRGAY